MATMRKGRFTQFTVLCAGMTLFSGLIYAAVAALILNPVLFITGEILLLMGSFTFWARGLKSKTGLKIIPKTATKTGTDMPQSLLLRTTHKVASRRALETLSDLRKRIEAVLEQFWLQNADMPHVKIRLKAALQSWHEDLAFDFPITDPKMVNSSFQHLLNQTDALLSEIEALAIAQDDNLPLLERVEEKILSQLLELQLFLAQPS